MRRPTGWEDTLPRIVQEHPGATVDEVTRHVRVGQGSVGIHLLALVRRGVLRREGRGGSLDPFRYYPVEVPGDS